MGDKFPKHIYHSIICIGALIAHQDGSHWEVDSLGAPHVGERSEKELITAFVNRVAELTRIMHDARRFCTSGPRGKFV